jgi:hypothetical protein
MGLLPLTDSQIAALAAAAYTAAPTWQAGDVHAVRVDVPDLTVVAWRGTVPTSLDDWLRDVDAVPTWHPQLGICHRGFLTGAEALMPAILADTAGDTLVMTGHSLGGALAIAGTGLAVAAGRSPAGLVTFGAPRVGFHTLRTLLDRVPIRQYRNASDPVPDVPPFYEHVAELIEIGEPDFGGIHDHAVALYDADVSSYLARMALNTDPQGTRT